LVTFGVGITSGVVLIVLLALVFALIRKCRVRQGRKQRTKSNKSNSDQSGASSDLNLYYTCEKQMQPVDDEFSIFKFKKVLATPTTCSSSSSSGESAAFISAFKTKGAKHKQSHRHHDTAATDHDNVRVYNNLLLDSGIYHNPSSVEQHQLLVASIPHVHHQQYEHKLVSANHQAAGDIYHKMSAFRPINATNSSTCSSASSNKNNNSCTTKSINLTSSPSSNAYYSTPNNLLNPAQQQETYKIVSASNMATPHKAHQQHHLKSPAVASRRPASFLKDTSVELAYDIVDSLNVKQNIFQDVDASDICMSQVTSAGAKLTLDGGLSLLIPEGALSDEQCINMYLCVSRKESLKPKLSDKNTFLSDVITIGPSNLTLLKPVVLIVDHCAHRINDEWTVRLYSSFNFTNIAPDWTVSPSHFPFF
jgi:hypothetical protein